jgi:hypothetical protein
MDDAARQRLQGFRQPAALATICPPRQRDRLDRHPAVPEVHERCRFPGALVQDSDHANIAPGCSLRCSERRHHAFQTTHWPGGKNMNNGHQEVRRDPNMQQDNLQSAVPFPRISLVSHY